MIPLDSDLVTVAIVIGALCIAGLLLWLLIAGLERLGHWWLQQRVIAAAGAESRLEQLVASERQRLAMLTRFLAETDHA